MVSGVSAFVAVVSLLPACSSHITWVSGLCWSSLGRSTEQVTHLCTTACLSAATPASLVLPAGTPTMRAWQAGATTGNHRDMLCSCSAQVHFHSWLCSLRDQTHQQHAVHMHACTQALSMSASRPSAPWDELLGWHRWRDCYSDEHYFPTLLASLGKDLETDCVGQLINVDWSRGGAHPRAYLVREVSAARCCLSLRLLPRVPPSWTSCRSRG